MKYSDTKVVSNWESRLMLSMEGMIVQLGTLYWMILKGIVEAFQD